jgi:ferredoxin, 2Fe-2S
MVKIIIENLGQKEVVVTGSNKTALQLFHADFIDWLHACGAKGRCTTCKMIIVEGGDRLGELTEAEKDYRRQGLLKENERLACQVRVNGNVKVRVPDESKLPHMRYTG